MYRMNWLAPRGWAMPIAESYHSVPAEYYSIRKVILERLIWLCDEHDRKRV